MKTIKIENTSIDRNALVKFKNGTELILPSNTETTLSNDSDVSEVKGDIRISEDLTEVSGTKGLQKLND